MEILLQPDEVETQDQRMDVQRFRRNLGRGLPEFSLPIDSVVTKGEIDQRV